MAERIMKEHLYGDLLSPTAGYHTDFALGMTYSLSFEALLTAHLAFGMLGEMDENVVQSPHYMLEAITKSCEKVVVFCNKGGISVPPTIRKVYSLMERNIFEVFDRNEHKNNFHPKLWLIREVSNEDKTDIQLKLVVTSRNLSYSDNIDCIVSITGKIGSSKIRNEKHRPLHSFIREVVKESNITEEQRKKVLKLADDLMRIEKFDVEEPFEDYDFFPYLFNKEFGLPDIQDYLVGTEGIIVSPFLDRNMIYRLLAKNRYKRALITRKENINKEIFDKFREHGGVYIALDDLASKGIDIHAKMYHIWNGRDNQYLFMGSANATTKAFNGNGEFMLRLKYRYGNTCFGNILKEFYDEENSDSKFMPLYVPYENGTSEHNWDDAEISMKELMCSDDIKARIVRHRDGFYSITVTSRLRKLKNDVFIAPFQKREMMQKWSGRVEFGELKAEDLSEFYILSATSAEGVRHQSIIKIETTGMPSDRDNEIYRGIIKTSRDFFRFIELMLSDSPLQIIVSEAMNKESKGVDNDQNDAIQFNGLYEKMLKVAATKPAQIKEIGKLINKLDKETVPEPFLKVYNQFVKAIKN